MRETSKKFIVLYQNLSPKVYTKVLDSGVMFYVRFLCEPKKRRASEELIWEHVLTQFEQNDDIDLAYPTQRFYTLENQNAPVQALREDNIR